MAYHLAPGSDCPADAELRRQAGIPQRARALIVAVSASPVIRAAAVQSSAGYSHY